MVHIPESSNVHDPNFNAQFCVSKKIQNKNLLNFSNKIILTNGNVAISNGQIDLNIPGGTYSISPVCCTTAFTRSVLSNFSSAL
jgi:archaellum component FlaF (FlaF/FlaG flagellin family)